MDENTLKTLQTSEDPKELLRAAMALARSVQSSDHEALLRYLTQPTFLKKLDTPADYANSAAKRLRVAQVLKALGENSAPSAHGVLVALSKSEEFLAEPIRVDYLIGVSGDLKQEASQLVPFWERFSKPDDGHTNLTVRALVRNDTTPAMEVLEKRMADPGHEDDDKISWMRSVFVPRRDNFELLKSFERMLTGKMPDRLQPELVDVIFDYKPGEWYRPANAVSPPDRTKIGPREKQQLIRLGEIALGMANVKDSQKEVIKKTLEDLK